MGIEWIISLCVVLGGYIMAAYYKAKANEEKNKRVQDEYENAKKGGLDALKRSETADLVRDSNLRLNKRRRDNRGAK